MENNFVEISRNINIDSTDGISIDNKPEYLSNLIFQFRGLLYDDENILMNKISFVDAQIPRSFYNINENNNTLMYSVNGVIQTIIIPFGNYNENTLSKTIISLFNNNGYIFTINFDKITGILTFETTNDFLFYGSEFLIILGFTKGLNYSSVVNTLVAPYPMSVLGTRKLKICSNQLSCGNLDSFTNNTSNIIQYVPINCLPNQIIIYNNLSNKSFEMTNSKNIDFIDISILDDNNQYVNFNNIPWSMTLCITSIKKLQIHTGKFSDGTIEIGSINRDDDDLDFLMYENNIYV